jgi:purine-binding chemotaxis protein CheW
MSTAVAEPEVRGRAANRGGKYLTFFFGQEEYGIEILRVREIIGLMPITAVPRAPDYIRGVVNLRGKVIPVLDLRTKFGMEGVEETEQTCIIVVQSGEDLVGVVVDQVSEVLDISGEDIVDAPALGADINTDYILGLGKAQGSVKILLDIDRALASDDELDPSRIHEAVAAAE